MNSEYSERERKIKEQEQILDLRDQLVHTKKSLVDYDEILFVLKEKNRKLKQQLGIEGIMSLENTEKETSLENQETILKLREEIIGLKESLVSYREEAFYLNEMNKRLKQELIDKGLESETKNNASDALFNKRR